MLPPSLSQDFLSFKKVIISVWSLSKTSNKHLKTATSPTKIHWFLNKCRFCGLQASVGATPRPETKSVPHEFSHHFGLSRKKTRTGSQVKQPSLRRPHVATVMNGPWMSSPSDPGGSTCTGWSNPIWTYGWFNGDPYPALKFNGLPSEKWWGGWFRRSGFLLGFGQFSGA